eukprot:11164785-Lingulodinium_polyedra.AAC.1
MTGKGTNKTANDIKDLCSIRIGDKGGNYCATKRQVCGVHYYRHEYELHGAQQRLQQLCQERVVPFCTRA